MSISQIVAEAIHAFQIIWRTSPEQVLIHPDDLSTLQEECLQLSSMFGSREKTNQPIAITSLKFMDCDVIPDKSITRFTVMCQRPL